MIARNNSCEFFEDHIMTLRNFTRLILVSTHTCLLSILFCPGQVVWHKDVNLRNMWINFKMHKHLTQGKLIPNTEYQTCDQIIYRPWQCKNTLRNDNNTSTRSRKHHAKFLSGLWDHVMKKPNPEFFLAILQFCKAFRGEVVISHMRSLPQIAFLIITKRSHVDCPMKFSSKCEAPRNFQSQ